MMRIDFMKSHLPAQKRGVLGLIICLTILCAGAACQTTMVPTSVAPSLIPISATARPVLQVATTPPPRVVLSSATPMPLMLTPPPSPPSVPTNSLPMLATGTLVIEETQIGTSSGGRAITAVRLATGARVIVLVGGLHGGWEANTVELVTGLLDHFTGTPADLLSDFSLVLVPVANPDGLALGATEQGRFNGAGVDLNRNWGCDWSAESYWRDQQVDAGARALSEPETAALANFLLSLRPVAALFYHSAADGVFPGNCRGDHGSLAMATVYAAAAGYACCDAFNAYPVSGTAATWADGVGIPAADVELTQSTDPELARNLRAIIALQEWLKNRG